jgi:VWFA-related protein
VLKVARICLPALISLVPISLFAQGHGGGGGSRPPNYTNPADNARNAAVLGKGGTLAGPYGSPSARDEARIEFRTQTILVQVPAVVVDKAGKHVHGLTQNDFTVLENGKPVKVEHFEELTASATAILVPPSAPGIYRNLSLQGVQPHNIVVIAIDTVNTPFLDQAYGRRELVKFLVHNVDSSQVLALMLITSRGLRVVQGLTSDPIRLLAILKKASGEISPMETESEDAQADMVAGTTSQTDLRLMNGTDPFTAMSNFVNYGDVIEAQFRQQNAIETTMNAFLGIAWMLSGVPGRKSLIWETGGFPFQMSSPDDLPGGNLSPLYERTMLALNEAEISVYPVDVRGLMSNPMVSATRGAGMMGSQQLGNRMWLQQSKFDTLNDFADMTGGKAFYNTNDVTGSFRRAADDGASYYMLGYYLDTHNNKPGWRKLHVKVDRGDVEVRSKSGFLVTNTTMNPKLTRDLDMLSAMHSPIEGTGIPVSVQWLGFSTDGEKKKASFLAHMAPGSLSFDPSGQDLLNFDFAAVAFDKNGKEVAQAAQNFSKPVPETQLASVRANGVGFRNSLELSPGTYTVRFVVRDNVTGKIGSVTAPLTVN